MENVAFFTVPDEKVGSLAIGSLAGTPIRVKKALNVLIPHFGPLPKPGPTDWLAEHDEDGQAYDTYLSQPKNLVDEKRKVIYIQPLGKGIDKTFLQNLKKFVQAYYYGLEVKLLTAIKMDKLEADSRQSEETGKIQYNATQILKKLETKLRSDAYCLIAICMEDLYPRDEWNFVFGLASMKNRTGIFSFARYQEDFYDQQNDESEERPDVDDAHLLWRSLKVMVHEIGHMFGLRHCIYFNCIMNGSNTLEENDKKPIFMCPVCIRKLQYNVKFEFYDRCKALQNVCLEIGEEFEEAAEWYGEVASEILKAYGPHYKPKKQAESGPEVKLKKSRKTIS